MNTLPEDLKSWIEEQMTALLPKDQWAKHDWQQGFIAGAEALYNHIGQAAGRLQIAEIDKARFWTKVILTDYCWNWGAGKNSDGYGVFKFNGNDTGAHRVSYQIVNGIIPQTLHVLHKCDNPSCVNPDHLFTGTHQDNMQDKERKGRGGGGCLGRKSQYYGVGFRNDSKNWRAYLYVREGGKRKHLSLGNFNNEIDAAKRRDQEVIKLNIDLPLNFKV